VPHDLNHLRILHSCPDDHSQTRSSQDHEDNEIKRQPDRNSDERVFGHDDIKEIQEPMKFMGTGITSSSVPEHANQLLQHDHAPTVIKI